MFDTLGFVRIEIHSLANVTFEQQMKRRTYPPALDNVVWVKKTCDIHHELQRQRANNIKLMLRPHLSSFRFILWH